MLIIKNGAGSMRTMTCTSLAITAISMAVSVQVQAQQCIVPNTIANGQIADATKVMDNFSALAACLDNTKENAVTHEGTPTTGEIAVFVSATGITGGNLTGDVTTTGSTVTTLADTAVAPGVYSNATFEVDSKGRITSAVNGPPGGSGSSGMALISKIVADGTTSSITFSTIPQNHQDLVLVVTGQSSSPAESLIVYANGDTNSANYRNFTWNQFGRGTWPKPRVGTFPGVNVPAPGAAANMNIEFHAYSNVNWQKYAMSRSQYEDSPNFFINNMEWKWISMTPITSLTLQIDNGTFVSGTTFSLYGRGAN